MAAHARLSFSAADRWIACAASVGKTEALTESSESEAAKEGTIAHAALERSLTNWLVTGEETITCDDPEMAEHLQPCMDYVIERYELLPGSNKLIEFEVKVDLHYLSNRDDLWGTSDVIISSDRYIDVIDLKYGRGIFVPADTNQNRLYILGAMARHMKKTKGEVPWVNVRSTIMQPRFKDDDGEIIRYEEFAPDELFDWFENTIMPAAVASDNAAAIPVAGEKQCRWCLAKSTCPAVAQRVTDLCSVFEPVALTADAKPENLDIEKLIEVHDNIPFVQGYLKAVSERLRALLEARHPDLEGRLKLVRNRQINKWDREDTEILEALTSGKGKINKSDITKTVVLTAPQALKLKLRPAQKKRLEEYVTKSEGSLTIVPWTDERKNEFPPITFEDQTKVHSGALSDETFDFL